MGSVIPLLAVAEAIKDKYPEADLYWLGTETGPEKKVVEGYNIEYKAITAGKWRRYFSWKNFSDGFMVLYGFCQALLFLSKKKPQVVVSAGAYVAVPVVWAAWFLGIPSLIHQQDVRPGLANRLCAGAAKKITVCFESSLKYFKSKKTLVVGNPVRESLKNNKTDPWARLNEKYSISKKLPLVLIMGGGTGSYALNRLVLEAADELTAFAQIVHVSGGRLSGIDWRKLDMENYYHFSFLTDNTPFLRAATVVVSRAGMGSLTEIAYLSKPAIIIPIPNSHQEDNADYFYQRKAIIKLEQGKLNKKILVSTIKDVLDKPQRAARLGRTAHQAIKWGAEEKLAEMIAALVKK